MLLTLAVHKGVALVIGGALVLAELLAHVSPPTDGHAFWVTTVTLVLGVFVNGHSVVARPVWVAISQEVDRIVQLTNSEFLGPVFLGKLEGITVGSLAAIRLAVRFLCYNQSQPLAFGLFAETLVLDESLFLVTNDSVVARPVGVAISRGVVHIVELTIVGCVGLEIFRNWNDLQPGCTLQYCKH